MITEPGLYEGVVNEYYGDPCPKPSLNNSLIAPLLQAPAKAYELHPRLNKLFTPEDDTKFDLGTVAHKLMLGAGREFRVLEFDAWRSNASKDARADAIAAGLIPIKRADFERAQNMVIRAREEVQFFEGCEGAFDLDKGQFEIGLFWLDEVGCWGRSLIDRLRSDLPTWEVWDYKTTDRCVRPEDPELGRHVVAMGYDTQCAIQERGLLTILPDLAGRLKFRMLFQETAPPYLISVVEPDEATLTIARKKVDLAFREFAACLEADHWPGYTARIIPLRHAEWMAQRWLEREIAENEVRETAAKFAEATIIRVAEEIRNKRRPGRPLHSRNKTRQERIDEMNRKADNANKGTILDAG